MNKVPRFVREYANYQKKFAETLPNKEEKENIVTEINRTIRALEKGWITTNEAIESILCSFDDK